MTTSTEEHVNERATFDNGTTGFMGTARFLCDLAYGLDADVGGVDGWDVTEVTLLWFRDADDDLTMSRAELVARVGEATVADVEQRTLEYLSELERAE